MKISHLFKDFQAEIIGEDREISSICFQEEKVTKGSIFFCLNNSDYAENQIKTAVFNGAIAVVSESDIDTKVTHIKVDNCRKALSIASSKFYNYNKNIKIIGVVGTNGKTSTCNMLEQLLSSGGKRVGTICTGQAKFGELIINNEMTTPDPPKLFEIISKMSELGAEYIVMEVSAHAIFFHKCFAIKFSYLIFIANTSAGLLIPYAIHGIFCKISIPHSSSLLTTAFSQYNFEKMLCFTNLYLSKFLKKSKWS